MNEIQQFIVNDVHPLSLTDSIEIAQDIALEYKFSHIPVVDDNVYLGCLIAEDAENVYTDAIIADFKYNFEKFFVLESSNWFDVLQVFSKNATNIVPILNDKKQYIGFYELSDCIKLFSETPFLKEEGSTIIVEKNSNSYSFSEVSQIIESNNSRILGVFISNFNNDLIELSIKINTQNMNQVLQTFRRYNYIVLSEHIDDAHVNDLKDHSDYLDKYLNI